MTARRAGEYVERRGSCGNTRVGDLSPAMTADYAHLGRILSESKNAGIKKIFVLVLQGKVNGQRRAGRQRRPWEDWQTEETVGGLADRGDRGRTGRQRRLWEDNIIEWTGMSFEACTRAAENQER